MSAPSPATDLNEYSAAPFQPFHSAVDVSFWSNLGHRKLSEYKLDTRPIDVVGGFTHSTRSEVGLGGDFCSCCRLSPHPLLTSSSQIQSQLCLSGDYSFPTSTSTVHLPPPLLGSMFGRLLNTNTSEDFKKLPIAQLLEEMRDQMWNGIKERVKQGAATPTSLTRLLSRFLLISYADLKSHKYAYMFAFPALSFDQVKILEKKVVNGEAVVDNRIGVVWNEQTARSLVEQYQKFAKENVIQVAASSSSSAAASESTSPAVSEIYFIVLRDSSSGAVRVLPFDAGLQEYSKDKKAEIYLGFIDSSALPEHVGWTARNMLIYAYVSGLLGEKATTEVKVLAFRDGNMSTGAIKGANSTSFSSRVFTYLISSTTTPSEILSSIIPKVTGWERHPQTGKSTPRVMDLGSVMDPLAMSKATVNLNLELMKWRALPELDLEKIAATKCLLVGSGTLGCAVARVLAGWGVKHITFLDNGYVSYSNPIRQSLYEFNDASKRREKAVCAAEAMKRIHPLLQCEGIQLQIPMPGHKVNDAEKQDTLDAIHKLTSLIDSHDAIFLLTDSRESRWLPTVLAAAKSKLVLNTAIGFDTFVVMRHGDNYNTGSEGAAASSASSSSSSSSSSVESSHPKLGCYFCNDVVAPTDSLTDRTLDQQCTVTRPGLAFLSSSLVVEMFIATLHHPLRQRAPADLSTSTPLSSGFGLIPHQLRGFLSRFDIKLVCGEQFQQCTACSRVVLDEYVKRGDQFIMDVLNGQPSFLEDLSGISKMKQETDKLFAEMEQQEGFDDLDDEF